MIDLYLQSGFDSNGCRYVVVLHSYHGKQSNLIVNYYFDRKGNLFENISSNYFRYHPTQQIWLHFSQLNEWIRQSKVQKIWQNKPKLNMELLVVVQHRLSFVIPTFQHINVCGLSWRAHGPAFSPVATMKVLNVFQKQKVTFNSTEFAIGLN